MRLVLVILFIMIFCTASFSQIKDPVTGITSYADSILQSYNAITTQSLTAITSQYNKLTTIIQAQSIKLLERMQTKEIKLRKKLQGIDSNKAKELFIQAPIKYNELLAKLYLPVDKHIAEPLKEYISGIDSLQTALKFLTQFNGKIPNIPIDKLQQLEGISSQLQELQSKLQQANDIQSFIKGREAQLKAALLNKGVGKQLISINKEVFYYQERLADYKALLQNKKEMEEKLLAAVRNLPAFQSFVQKHSYLAFLFPMPANYGMPQALEGLQTRANVQNIICQNFGTVSGSAPINTQQYMQQQMGSAKTQLNTLKDKINKLSGGGSSDITMPDFKPNPEKTKSLLSRLEYGFNVQSEKSRYLIPVTSDLALTIGYKINTKSSIGLGASYKMGWGSGWDHIKLTSEGIGFRSYVDIKAKGSIWFSGGLEYNYLQNFDNIERIKNLDAWQKSGLIGLTKKYKMGKKEGKMQLLWDFMSEQEVLHCQKIKFRIGYNF